MIATPRQYAEGLYLALAENPEQAQAAIIKNLVELLRKHKHSRYTQAIIKEYERLVLKKSGHHSVVIESAAPLPSSHISKIQELFHHHAVIHSKVNKELLAGLTILIDDSLYIDASGRTRINQLLTTRS